MDSLLIPFTLWGVSPFVSQNYDYIFGWAGVQDLNFLLSDDRGLFLRRLLSDTDSLPVTTIYSIQYPDEYTLFGFSFSRYIGRFLLTAHYDYSDPFKQASIRIGFKNMHLSYYDVFKLGKHARLVAVSYGKNIVSYQILGDREAGSLSFLGSYMHAKKDTLEVWLMYPFNYKMVHAKLGLYYFHSSRVYPSLLVHVGTHMLGIRASLKPYTLYPYGFVDAWKFSLYLGNELFQVESFYMNELVLSGKDSSRYRKSKLVGISLDIENTFVECYASYLSEGLIGAKLHIALRYPYELIEGIVVQPNLGARYYLNRDDMDMYVLYAGISLNFYQAVLFKLEYMKAPSFENYWFGDYYSVMFYTSLED